MICPSCDGQQIHRSRRKGLLESSLFTIMSPNSPLSALKPKFSSFDSRTRPTTSAPSRPAFWAIWRKGSRRDVWVEPLDYERAVVVNAAQRKTKEKEREKLFQVKEVRVRSERA
jgi:hypothetical protein